MALGNGREVDARVLTKAGVHNSKQPCQKHKQCHSGIVSLCSNATVPLATITSPPSHHHQHSVKRS